MAPKTIVALEPCNFQWCAPNSETRVATPARLKLGFQVLHGRLDCAALLLGVGHAKPARSAILGNFSTDLEFAAN